MTSSVNGLIIRAADYGENHRIFTLLTAEYGKISAGAYGARSLKNPLSASLQMMNYCELHLSEKRGRVTISEAAVIEDFRELRLDALSMAVGQYFCEVSDDVTLENEPAENMLRHTLNSLWALAHDPLRMFQIKAVFEMRTACISGFMPDLVACRKCGCGCGDNDAGQNAGIFDISDGSLLCSDCHIRLPVKDLYYENGTMRRMFRLSPPLLSALRYIISAPDGKQLAFRTDDETGKMLSELCELYLTTHLEHSYKSLNFINRLQTLKASADSTQNEDTNK